MKRLGLIGGTTWHSTVDYYSNINKLVGERCGGLNSADLVLVSVNFAEIDRNLRAGDLGANKDMFVDAAQRLRAAGAQGLVLCANTMHLDANDVERASGLPVINLIDAAAEVVKARGIDRVALLGTKLTMEKDFFTGRLEELGIETLIPDEADRGYIHDSIFNELGKGLLLDDMRQRYVRIIESLAASGAQGVILGCTEIPLLISDKDVSVPTFDTVKIHAEAAVKFMLD